MDSRTSPSLEGAEAWLLRANEHLGEVAPLTLDVLKAEREAMIASLDDPELVEVGIEGSLRLAGPVTPIPIRISILIGEAIQALRRSLDYLIYELAWLDSGKPKKRTQFPLDDSDLDFWRRLKRVKRGPAAYLIGVSGEHAAAIERYQPYFGTHWTKLLQDISNPDKHRHLTITKTQNSVTVTAEAAKNQARIRRLYNGFTVFMPYGDDMQMKFEVTLYVALDDGTRVVDALQEIQDGVNYILFSFDPCFKGKCPH